MRSIHRFSSAARIRQCHLGPPRPFASRHLSTAWDLPVAVAAGGQLVRTPELHPEVERKRSPVYNELLGDMAARRGLNVRLDGPAGSDVMDSG